MVFVFEVIGVLVFTAAIAVAVNGIEDYHKRTVLISLEEFYKKTEGLLIAPFTNNGKTLNFIIDTGANYSVINQDSLEDCIYETSDYVTTMTGISGEPMDVDIIAMTIKKDNTKFEEVFQVHPMPVVEAIEKQTGIKVDGLIGGAFLKKYNFKIDYSKMITYTKV